MQQFPHADLAGPVRLLIALALWVGLSVPIALLAGRALQSPRRRRRPADEVETYLRRRSPRHRAVSLAASFVGLLAVLGLGHQAVRQLPAAHVAASRGMEALLGTTSTTLAAAQPATTPAASPAVGADRGRARSAGDAPATEATPRRHGGKARDKAGVAPPDREPRHERRDKGDEPGGDEEAALADGDEEARGDEDRDRRERRGRDRDDGEDDEHDDEDRRGKDDDDEARSTTTTSTTSTSTTSTTQPEPTPSGSTTTTTEAPPSTTTTTTAPPEREED